MFAAYILTVTLQKKVSHYWKYHKTAHVLLALELNLGECISNKVILTPIILLTTSMIQLMGDFA